MHSRAAFLRSAGAASLAGVLPRAARAAGPIVCNVINTGSTDSYVMQNIVQDNGYLARFGVSGSPTNVSDGIKLLASVLQGGSDVAIMTGFTQVFPAIQAGARLKLLSATTTGPDYAVYTANPAVTSLKNLEGKSVGIGAVGALTYVAMSAMLQRAGVDRDTVRFVNIGASDDAIKAVLARKIDACPAQHDYVEDVRAAGGRVIAESPDIIPMFMTQAMFASDQAIATRRDAIVRTMAAYGEGFRFMSDHRHGVEFTAAYEKAGGTADHARIKWSWYKTHSFYAQNLQLPLDRLDYMQKLNVRLGLQREVMPLNRVADLSLARDALRLMG